ncbi:MAG: ArsA-related P-loop ATPase [Bdellovibrionales bacterium]
MRRTGGVVIHFVTGKGGVGKSTVAASLAWHLSSLGRKTLLVELGERSHYRHVFHFDVGHEPTAINSSLSVVRWEGEACLREYLQHFIKVEQVVRLFFDNRIMRALVQAAPALRELALLGKITSGYRNVGPSLPFDDIVVDAYSTGHFRALWRAPIGMAEAISFGPMGHHSRGIVEVMRDRKQSTYHVVVLPEEMPVTEGLELARQIQQELEQEPKMVLNRWFRSPLSKEQLIPYASHEFGAYLLRILNRQERADQDLTTRGPDPQKLSWVFKEGLADKIRVLAAEWPK